MICMLTCKLAVGRACELVDMVPKKVQVAEVLAQLEQQQKQQQQQQAQQNGVHNEQEQRKHEEQQDADDKNEQ